MTDEVIFQMMGEHPLPEYETPGAAGFDLRAYLPEGGVLVAPGEVEPVTVGFKVRVPTGKELQIRPRSGLALRHKVTVLNSPGTVDSDFRGEVKVLVYNAGRSIFSISHGDRIAQGVIAEAAQHKLTAGTVENDTDRGADGFGSTGVK